MVDIGRAHLKLVIDERDVERSVGDAVGKAEPGISKAFGGVAKKAALAFGGIFAAGQATSFFGDAISGASGLAETLSKNKVVFGGASAQVLDFAKNSATAFGQSQEQALEATGVFGNLLRAVGLSEEQSAKFSVSMTGLASDLASFNNVPVADALDAIRSGLVGETEPLKRFGVNMNEATLKAKALELGLGDGKSVLDANAKAQAAYALIMEQTSLAQGDFARTSDGLANKQRILGAQFENLKTRIGRGLVPVMTGVVTFLTDKMLPAFDTMGKKVGPAIAAVAGGFKQILTIFTDRDFVGGGPFAEDSPFVNAMFVVRDFVTDSLLPAIRQFAEFLSNNLKPILIGVGVVLAAIFPTAFFAAIALAYVKFKGFRDVVNTVARAIAAFAAGVVDVIGGLIDWWKGIWPQVSEAVGHVLAVIGDYFKIQFAIWKKLWQTFGDEILAVVKIAFDYVRGAIDAVLKVIRGVIQTVLALINGDWGKAWDGLKTVAAGAFDAVKNVVVTAGRLLVQAFEGVLSSLRLLWDGAWGAMGKVVGGIWDGIVKIAKGAVNALIGAIEFLINTGLEPLRKTLALADKLNGPLSIPDIPTVSLPRLDTRTPVPTTFERGGPILGTAHTGGLFDLPVSREFPAVLRGQEMVLPDVQAMDRIVSEAIRSGTRAMANIDGGAAAMPTIEQHFHGQHDPVDAQREGTRAWRSELYLMGR